MAGKLVFFIFAGRPRGRRFRALKLWFVLRRFGARGVRAQRLSLGVAGPCRGDAPPSPLLLRLRRRPSRHGLRGLRRPAPAPAPGGGSPAAAAAAPSSSKGSAPSR